MGLTLNHAVQDVPLSDIRRFTALVRNTPGACSLTTGATEGLFIVLSTILNPGDEVIIPTPAFSLYESITRLCQVRGYARPAPRHPELFQALRHDRLADGVLHGGRPGEAADAGFPPICGGIGPAFVQPACAAALESDTAPMVDLFRRRRDFVYLRLTGMGLEAQKPEGAFYMFVRVPDCGLGSQAFCEKMLKEGLVGLIPGTYFGTEGFMRLSYCYSDEDLDEGLNRMGHFLKTL